MSLEAEPLGPVPLGPVPPAEAALLSARVAALRAALAEAAVAAGRSPDSVRLLLATKTQSAERIAAALSGGHRLIGENRAQELRDKFDPLRPLEPEWHFIGPLQRNKLRMVVGRAALIHSIDNLGLAQAVGEERLRQGGQEPQKVLLQVNISGEATKSGAPPEAALALARAVVELPGVALVGLMAIPAADATPEEARQAFARLAGLAAAGRAEGLPLRELSMGMSGDYPQAVAEGATLVRVGSAIFGAR
jgi:pyridoxal phosphate enzyme (YggS family)